MPLFDYICKTCGHKKEVLLGINENRAIQCVPCNQIMVRQLSTSNFSFKGSGFYKNDYPKGS